jgi:hypothetical protein
MKQRVLKVRSSRKPVHKCYSCPLNLGDHCWAYSNPRERWRDGHKCPGFENEEVYGLFNDWKKQPHVKTRQELRREFFEKRKRPPTAHLEED